ncbi:hypothetical protein B0J14DRAFT_658438 [Halenospora varia]|nr:hypothetical protein B0J14DRAFT_658438 [Halenospora varia]
MGSGAAVREGQTSRSERRQFETKDSRETKDYLTLDTPFTEKNFEEVLSEFQLPLATPWVIGSIYPHFEHRSIKTGDDLIVGFTMRIPTRRVTEMNIALSISHNTTTRQTQALLIGLSEDDQKSLYKKLINPALSNFCFHPLLLPTLLTCTHEFLLHERVDLLYGDLVRIEKWSGQTVIPSPDLQDSPTMGESALTRRALTIAQIALPAESEAQALIQTIDLIRNSIDSVDRPYEPRSPDVEAWKKREERIRAAAKVLRDYLDCCNARAHTALWDFQFLAQRADALMNALYSYAAQQTAIASKRDGAAMKAIALLTMFFLPATFFATLFAMPLLDVSAPPGQSMIRDRFWMYWAFVGPVTFTVIAFYIAWTFVDKRLEAKEQKAAKADTGGAFDSL